MLCMVAHETDAMHRSLWALVSSVSERSFLGGPSSFCRWIIAGTKWWRTSANRYCVLHVFASVQVSTWTCLAIANWTMVVSSCLRDSHWREMLWVGSMIDNLSKSTSVSMAVCSDPGHRILSTSHRLHILWMRGTQWRRGFMHTICPPFPPAGVKWVPINRGRGFFRKTWEKLEAAKEVEVAPCIACDDKFCNVLNSNVVNSCGLWSGGGERCYSHCWPGLWKWRSFESMPIRWWTSLLIKPRHWEVPSS